jgi:hypothetical protein
MKSLYQPDAVREVKERISRVTLQSQRVWGKMDPAQMLAHLAESMEQATGDQRLPRLFMGRLLGGMVRKRVLGDAPMGKNAPTAPSMRIRDARDLEKERQRLLTLVDRFATAGPAGCTTHPHTFFGSLTPDEWSRLMYKHIDHHLTQFSV